MTLVAEISRILEINVHHDPHSGQFSGGGPAFKLEGLSPELTASVHKGVGKVLERYPQLKGAVRSIEHDPNLHADAQYDHDLKRIRIGNAIPAFEQSGELKAYSEFLRSSGTRVQGSGDHMADSIVHEYGHAAVEHLHADPESIVGPRQYGPLAGKQGLSSYANGKPHEAAAEAFADHVMNPKPSAEASRIGAEFDRRFKTLTESVQRILEINIHHGEGGRFARASAGKQVRTSATVGSTSAVITGGGHSGHEIRSLKHGGVNVYHPDADVMADIHKTLEKHGARVEVMTPHEINVKHFSRTAEPGKSGASHLNDPDLEKLFGSGTTLFHGGSASALSSDRPTFITSDRAGAHWYASERGSGGAVSEVKITAKNPATLGDLQTSVKATGATPADIRAHSTYTGEDNPLDYTYVPKVRQHLEKRGFDSVASWDALENGEIPTVVVWGAGKARLAKITESIDRILEINVHHDPHTGEFAHGGSARRRTGPRPMQGVDARVEVPRLTRITGAKPFDGTPIPTTFLSKQDRGKIGENVIIGFLRQHEKQPDARHANTKRNNFAVDIAYDHILVEGKAGGISNTKKAQQWRLTIGEPGKKEKAALKGMTAEQKRVHNARKEQQILERKAKAKADAERILGHKVSPRTMSTIIDHDRRVAYVYSFDGYHPRIDWTSAQAREGFVGAFKF